MKRLGKIGLATLAGCISLAPHPMSAQPGVSPDSLREAATFCTNVATNQGIPARERQGYVDECVKDITSKRSGNYDPPLFGGTPPSWGQGQELEARGTVIRQDDAFVLLTPDGRTLGLQGITSAFERLEGQDVVVNGRSGRENTIVVLTIMPAKGGADPEANMGGTPPKQGRVRR